MFIGKILPDDRMQHPSAFGGSPHVGKRGAGGVAAAALLLSFLLPSAGGAPAGGEMATPAGEPAPAAAPRAAGEPAAPSGSEAGPDSLSLAIEAALGEVRRHPSSAAARLPLAEAYRSRGNLVAARAALEEGLRLGVSGEDSIRAALLLADIAFRQGRSNEGRSRLAGLVGRGHATPELLAMVAQSRWDDHQPEEALTLGMEAVARDPDDAARLRWVAERWKEFGRLEQALSVWKRIAIRADATDEDVFQVGFLSQQIGDGQTAVDSYMKLLERRPDHPQGNYNLSLLMLSAGDTIDAMRRLETAILSAPSLHQAYFDLIVLYLKAGRVSDARRILTQFRTAARPDSVLDAEVQAILRGLEGQSDRKGRPR